ncbi:2Fe-2S iron-sulfur cluster-binding protein [Sphingobium sufflavum]|uniref:2Fe-2S iron-sulfur cluster-binding protein n=1 Tax=Sphingobium sufflavum TaxID=1129547 RepID=UPI001F2B446D|nr:2Fe-2S iron-sulfur cluster-binding protein [Sphingobium sufflavum]MCE7798302.1 2Fe-2S iron-sulfur cluster-binding protein [Sphingobium sufflavum]
MPDLIVIDRDGNETTVPSPSDRTVMEVIRDAGFDDMLALCGGCCSCATCHVFVDPAQADLLPAISADETDLLDTSNHRTEYSRLSCQIQLTESLSGLRVTLAPDD